MVIALKTRRPGIGVRIDKMAIGNAFEGIPKRLDRSIVFAQSFRAFGPDIRLSRIVGFLSLPFGFLASPAYFLLPTAPMRDIPQSSKPEDTTRNDCEGVSAFLYIGDTIFVESSIGNRSDDCVNLWAPIARNVRGED